MLYLAVIDSDDELLEETIKEIKNTIFLGGDKASYCFEITNITKAPEPDNLKDYHKGDWDDYRTFEPYDCGYADGYNQALKGGIK